MSYNVKLFYNTGFNGLNVPGSQTLIDGMTNNTFDPLDILQAGLLNSVSIRASWNDVRSADYCCIYNNAEKWYYSIEGIVMTSEDVATLALTLDPFTTISCIDGIVEFLDGITDRHHVATSEDTFGAFVEDDPYMIPSKALELVSGGRVADIKCDQALVEATVDLAAMATANEGVEYATSAAEPGTCVVPQVVPLGAADYTNVTLTDVGNYLTPVSSYFKLTTTVAEGIKRLRSLGAEGSILNCWLAPHSSTVVGTNRVTNVTDGFLSVSSGLPYAFATVQNQRILYGHLCKYILLSVASGNTASFDPEDIYGDGTSPLIKYIADPRPNGTPHFRFNYYLGRTDNFWENCIQGLPNPTAPLVYHDKSGSEVDRIKFNTNNVIAQEDASVAAARSMWGLATSTVSSGGEAYLNKSPESLIGNAIQWGIRGWDALSNTSIGVGIGPWSIGPGSLDKAGIISTHGLGQSVLDENNIQRQMANKRAREQQEFRLNTEVIAPTVNFPRSETLRDFVGNGVYVYRLRPSATDVSKFDKILNMYGYKDTSPVTKAMLTNRSKFNYIRVAGASVKTISQIPMWLRNSVSMQLSEGIRIWHVAPDTAFYTNGQNV